MTEPILQASHVHKDFVLGYSFFGAPKRIVHAVRNVSLSVDAGTTHAIVGESGSGKSTLGRCIAGLVEATSGDITLAGLNVSRQKSDAERKVLARQVQTIFQDPYSSLNPRRTVGQAILDGMEIHQLHDRQEREHRMQTLLKRVGLTPDHASRYPHQFSGGQRQRIAIARALALEPLFIIADEAVSALDVSVKAQILNLLSELQAERGLTYLFISHDLSVVRHFADRVSIMSMGQIIEQGSSDQIFEAPQQDYTRRLIDSVPRPDPARRRLRPVTPATSVAL